jgi:hypothetical protein
MAGAGAGAALAARHVDALALTAGLAATLLAVSTGVGHQFLADPKPRRGKMFFAMSGIWLVVAYLALGVGAWVSSRA